MGITQIYAQQPCHQCNGTAFYIGTNTGASGTNSFAGGNISTALANNSFVFGSFSNVNINGIRGIALGNYADVFQADGIAIGSYAKSNATNSYVFGQYLNATGSNSLTLGIGTSSGSPLTNTKNNSIMFGVTNKPSLTIAKYGNSDRGYLGIGTDAPEEMAHVVGKFLIERTSETESSLQFKHPSRRGDTQPTPNDYYWDIFSDTEGLKINTVNPNIAPVIPSQKVIISSSGSVGIGIIDPQAKLHVDNNILAEGNIATLDKFVLTPASNATSELWEISRTSAGLNFAYKDNGLQDVLFMSNNGFIGVGKTNPSVMFDVNGAFKATSATIPMITGNTEVTGTLTANALTANNANIKGALSANSATIAGALAANSAIIYGTTTIIGALTANSATINGAANISGALSASSATINGLLTANSAEITGKITGYSLSVKNTIAAGKIHTKEILVENTVPFPDFVFEDDYSLMNLQEVEQYIKEHKHLPAVPSAAEVEENGVNLGEMNAILIQKVEELTLYILDLQKQINELKTK